MPKYTKETESLKAKSLAKTCIENNLNQSAIARREGVSHQAVNQRVNRKPVQDCLRKYLESNKLKKKLEKVAEEGLGANRVISANITYGEADEKTNDFIDVPDHNARHKFWRDLMIVTGELKSNGNGNSISILNINYGYRSVDSSIRTERK